MHGGIELDHVLVAGERQRLFRPALHAPAAMLDIPFVGRGLGRWRAGFRIRPVADLHHPHFVRLNARQPLHRPGQLVVQAGVAERGHLPAEALDHAHFVGLHRVKSAEDGQACGSDERRLTRRARCARFHSSDAVRWRAGRRYPGPTRSSRSEFIITQNEESCACAADIVRQQAVTNRLIDELQQQQTSVREVFSIMARDPESVDYNQIMGQLAEADSNINRISAEGAQTAEHELWAALQEASLAFSAEARRLLSDDSTETYATVDLFRDHEAFVSVIGRLLAANYRKANAAQAQMGSRSSRLLQSSYVVATASVLLGLIFAVFTVRVVSLLIRRMEWQTAELSRVSWHMLEDQEATARRFSHELHDELGQALTAIRTNLSALESQATPEGCRIAGAWWMRRSEMCGSSRSFCGR